MSTIHETPRSQARMPANAQPNQAPNQFTTHQIKMFFSVLCFITGNFDILEHQFSFLGKKDQAKILLAGTLIENCGISYLKAALENSLTQRQKVNDNWVMIPNQYTLNDRTWLYPVIRACDPRGDYFKERDYGYNLIEKLSHDFGLELSTNNSNIHVDIYRVLELLCCMRAKPSLFDAREPEVNFVLNQVIGENFLSSVRELANECKLEGLVISHSRPNSPADDLSQGILLLITILSSFILTGLLLGFFYCSS